VNLLAAVAGAAVRAIGIAGQLTRTGLFFLPALAAAAVKLRREQTLAAREKV